MYSVNKKDAIITEEHAIFVVSFKQKNGEKLDDGNLVKLLQSELYDKHGTSGCFRLAPALKENLNADFIFGFKNMPDELLVPIGEDVKVAFLVDVTDPDVSLKEELFWFGEQISDFLAESKLSASQCNIDKLWKEIAVHKVFEAWREEVIKFANDDEPDFQPDEAFLKECYSSGASAIDAAEDCVENFNDNATSMTM
ncbi:hypothetical protein BM526_19255 (plasmid) [Alteromonas mediterranea]|uniref:hypothetical protein n=1 Tax=Alteromonas mediterranea TaxID=314275 RepID=UPI000903E313|nr:hypothetical protein [Alteromonas mediterranea]APE04108.1 hypothetical protein BM526_19255 [Alteromonas mediterranea]